MIFLVYAEFENKRDTERHIRIMRWINMHWQWWPPPSAHKSDGRMRLRALWISQFTVRLMIIIIQSANGNYGRGSFCIVAPKHVHMQGGAAHPNAAQWAVNFTTSISYACLRPLQRGADPPLLSRASNWLQIGDESERIQHLANSLNSHSIRIHLYISFSILSELRWQNKKACKN